MTIVRRIPSRDPRLGRHVEHDPRSLGYAYVPRKVELASKKHNRFIPVYDQGNLGSCTGNAGMGNLGTSPFYLDLVSIISDWSEDAAVQLYSDATKADAFLGEYPPDDTGSSGLAIGKVLKARGWIKEYRHTFSFDDMLAALMDGPVLLGINWYNNFFYPENGVITISAGDTVAGGHEIVVDEVDMENGWVGFTNSWGNWGENGRGYIPFDVLRRLLNEDGDVVVLIPIDSTNPPAPAPAPSGFDFGAWIASVWRAILKFLTGR